MSAEIHFALWSEPAQPEVVALGDEVRRFREIIFCGDGLKQFILRPAGQGTDRRRVARKHGVGKRVYPKHRYMHNSIFPEPKPLHNNLRLGMVKALPWPTQSSRANVQ